jgi:hypothetical protein
LRIAAGGRTIEEMSATRRVPSISPPPDADPREHAMAAALERARAARAELHDLRRRREEAIKRADAAIRALREPQAAPTDRVQDALDTIDRVTRIPTPGLK